MEHPRSCCFNYGDCATLSVVAVGSGPLYYKWKRDDIDIADLTCTGTNTPSLTILSVSSEHQGKYKCVVSDNQMSKESSSARIVVNRAAIKQKHWPFNVMRYHPSYYGDYHTPKGTIYLNMIWQPLCFTNICDLS